MIEKLGGEVVAAAIGLLLVVLGLLFALDPEALVTSADVQAHRAEALVLLLAAAFVGMILANGLHRALVAHDLVRCEHDLKERRRELSEVEERLKSRAETRANLQVDVDEKRALKERLQGDVDGLRREREVLERDVARARESVRAEAGGSQSALAVIRAVGILYEEQAASRAGHGAGEG